VNWTHIIIHHTGAEEKDAAQVRTYHKSLSWRDVGYHYVIERDGRVVPGRDLSLPGAHCRAGGKNFKGIGVALIGNLENHPPLAAQRAALPGLLAELCLLFNIQPDHVLGYREVLGAATACPGRYLDMAAVRQELAARLASGGKDAPAPPPGPEGGKASGLWRDQAGAFAKRENAEALRGKAPGYRL
jgi:N-acetyl-anhydromuramyl-L-alanine amidase AmpD